MSLARTVDLFEGVLTVTDKGIGTLGNEGESYLEDYVLRVEGLQRAIYNHYLVTMALSSTNTDRKVYVDAKKIDLNKIAVNIQNIFKMEYQRWLEAGYTQDSAKKKALNFARQYKEDSLKQHHKQFPESLDFNECMRMLNVDKKVSKKEKKSNSDL